MKKDLKEKNQLFRQCVIYCLKAYSDKTIVYTYFDEKNHNLVYFEVNKFTRVIKDNVNIYQTSLKNLYLYLFTEYYENSNQAILVYFANKYLKKYTSLDVQHILHVTPKQLEKFESGQGDFKGPFSFDNIAKGMGFDKKEFTQTFKDNFKKVT